MNTKQFFNYHANRGGKLLSIFLNGFYVTLNFREFEKILKEGCTIEISDVKYKLSDQDTVSKL